MSRRHSPGARWEVLYSSPLLNISDVECRPFDTECTHEFCYEHHRMAFLRSGHYRKHLPQTVIASDAGSVIYFPRREGFKTSHFSLDGDHCTFLDFDEDSLHTSAQFQGRRVKADDPFGVTHELIAPRVILSSRQLFGAVERGVASPLAIEEEALRLLSTMRARADEPRAPARSAAVRRLAEAARDALVAYACSNISLHHLARELGISPFYLARCFQSATGVTLHQYQMRLRLTIALEKVLAGAENLSALAHDTGFSSHSHLSYAFRRAFGLTPTQARLLK